MILETLNTPFSKALRNGNSTASAFASLNLQATAPVPVTSGPSASTGTDGVYDLSDHHYFTVNRLQLIPYADAAPGSQFSVRLYGWDVVEPPDANPNLIVWIPFLICELACTVSSLNGIAGHYIGATERVVDTISLTRGTTGTGGFAGGLINSTGPGTNLTAYALITLAGCRYIQFDFQRTSAGIGMNTLWGKA